MRSDGGAGSLYGVSMNNASDRIVSSDYCASRIMGSWGCEMRWITECVGQGRLGGCGEQGLCGRRAARIMRRIWGLSIDLE